MIGEPEWGVDGISEVQFNREVINLRKEDSMAKKKAKKKKIKKKKKTKKKRK
tara:strand:- start:235 stop:390 length:156 start_codon:yes stop_codon:yes gene_type:complete